MYIRVLRKINKQISIIIIKLIMLVFQNCLFVDRHLKHSRINYFLEITNDFCSFYCRYGKKKKPFSHKQEVANRIKMFNAPVTKLLYFFHQTSQTYLSWDSIVIIFYQPNIPEVGFKSQLAIRYIITKES